MKRLIKNKKILFCIILLILAVSLYAYSRFTKSEKQDQAFNGVITLTDKGFSPRKITIKQGESLTFLNKRKVPFWPASDTHPTHSLYPEFDPKQPVASGESWKFTFRKAGSWRFHDHLSPASSGQVIVTGSDQAPAPADCPPGSTGDLCWNDYITEKWGEEGAAGGLEAIGYLYRNDKAFVDRGCHAFAHIVGERALEELQSINYKDWDFPIEASFCGYGFLHGFFEHYFREHQDVAYAQEVCNYLGPKYKEKLPLLYINCYHGMGHGFIADPPDSSLWGDAQKMVDAGERLCEQIDPVQYTREREECFEGNFNVMVDRLTRSVYGLSEIDKDDPFALCKVQSKPEYRRACYYEFTMKVAAFVDNDIETAVKKYIDPIPEDDIASMVMGSTMASLMQSYMSRPDYKDFVLTCRKFSSRLSATCLSSIVGGLMAHGQPGQEHIKPIEVCGLPMLTTAEKSVCYDVTVHNSESIC